MVFSVTLHTKGVYRRFPFISRTRPYAVTELLGIISTRNSKWERPVYKPQHDFRHGSDCTFTIFKTQGMCTRCMNMV